MSLKQEGVGSRIGIIYVKKAVFKKEYGFFMILTLVLLG